MSILRRASIPVALAVISFAVVGCNDKKLEMENRTLSERLERVQAENTQLKVDKDQLNSALAGAQGQLSDKDKQLAGKDDYINQLKNGMVKLKGDYDELANKQRVFIGSPLPEAVNTALQKFAAENPDIATFDAQNGMVKLKSDLTFPSGSAVVNPKAADALAKLVKILNSAEAKKFAVYVAGHTDDMRIGKTSTRRKHPDNWYLSVHRAVGVQKALAKAGLAPARIALLGFGEYHPVAPNKAKKRGNQANRRVELWIVPPGSFLTTEAK